VTKHSQWETAQLILDLHNIIERLVEYDRVSSSYLWEAEAILKDLSYTMGIDFLAVLGKVQEETAK